MWQDNKTENATTNNNMIMIENQVSLLNICYAPAFQYVLYVNYLI